VVRVRLWDVATGRQRRRLDLPRVFIGAMAFSAARPMLAFGSGIVQVLDPVTGKEPRTLDPERTPISGVAFSPDGGTLAATSGSHDGWTRYTPYRLRLWNVRDGKVRWQTETRGESLHAVAFSPDGKLVVTGGGAVRLWEAATGKDLGKFEEGKGLIAFSADGKTLATCGPDRAVILWEVATRKPRRRFAGHDVSCLAFAPDGRTLATGGHDTLVMAWDVTGRMQNGRLRPGPPERKALEGLWAGLAAEDAAVAHDAAWGLASLPAVAVAFLRPRLPLVAEADHKRIPRLVAEMDDDAFAVRQRATEQLAALGVAAQDALRRCLEGKPSAEVRARALRLLRALRDCEDPNKDAGLRRGLRLIEALEQMGTAGAREALNQLSERGLGERLRQEAKASLLRLGKRRSGG
jgi:hypothetical protein